MSNFSLRFSVVGNRYFFTPKFTFATLILIIALVTLGIWQWQSAQEITQTIELINKRLLLDPIQVDDLDKSGDWRFYPIQLQGTFDNEHQILLTNKIYKGRIGFQVLTPFKPSNSSSEILVNRGWIADDPIKTPEITNIPDGVTITGILFKPSMSIMNSSSFDDDNIKWPLLSKRPDIEKLSKIMNTPLYPYTLLLSPSSPYGFTCEWLWLANAVEPERHKNYAMQWLALALATLLLFLFINTHREFK